MEDDVMLGRMNGARRRGRPRQRWLDTLKRYSSDFERSTHGQQETTRQRYKAGWRGAVEELPRLLPWVGCDSTAQGNKVTLRQITHMPYAANTTTTVCCVR